VSWNLYCCVFRNISSSFFSSSFDDEATELLKRIKSLKSYLAKERVGGINRRLESSLQVEIANLNRKLDEIRNKNNDDLTKTY